MAKKIKITVGEAIVRFLDNQFVSFDGRETKFVEGFYTIFGHGCVLGVGEALAMTKHSLKVYQGKNEQGMAQAAIAYAKQNNRRKILPCISSIGPGAANMVTAAATATVNNIPLLLFMGDTYATRRPDPVLQQLEQPHDLTVTTNDAFKPVTRFFDRVYRPEALMPALLNAMRVLTDTANTGAVAIALPQDVQGEVWEFPAELFEKRVFRITRPLPVKEELDAAAALIKKAKRPLIIVGGGARYSEAGAEIIKFAEEKNIPIAETQAGKSTLAGSHKLNLGGIGVTGNAMANEIASKSDLIIGLGTRFTDFTTSSKSLYAKVKTVTVNTSPFHGDKMNAFRVTGDVKVTVAALNAALKRYKSKYENEIETAKAKWEKEYERLAGIRYESGMETEVKAKVLTTVEDFHKATGAEITQTAAIALIRETIDKDAVIVGAAGSLPGCLQRMWVTDSLYTYNMEYGYSCMGYEIAGAFGSKLAMPDRDVYAMCGDGSYFMLNSEMVTAVQENKKITILLFDNGGFGCINNLQMGKGIDSLATETRYNAEAETPFLSIDFAMSARAYGFKAFTAKTLLELEGALLDAKKETCPCLIDIKTLPKTMTDGYPGGFWQVGINRAPRNAAQSAALKEQIEYTK